MNCIAMGKSFITVLPLCAFVIAGCLPYTSSKPLDEADVLDGTNLFDEEELLRNCVNYIYKSGLFCSPKWSSFSSPDVTLSTSIKKQYSTDLLTTFHPVFENVFTPQKLTRNYFTGIKFAVKLVRMINNFYQEKNGVPTKNLLELLNSVLKVEKSISLRVNLSELTTTRSTPLSYSTTVYKQERLTADVEDNSSVIGIGICKSNELVSYATTADSHDREALRHNCIQMNNNNEMSVPQSTVSFTDDVHGRFVTIWMINQCEQATNQTPVVRLFVYSPEQPWKMRFFFEFDLKNFVLDQCALNINRCGATTKCVYKMYGESPFSMDNYICRCTDSFYLDNPENGYPAPFINSQIKAASGEKLPRFYCRSCPPGCHQCSVNHSCRARLDLNLLRAIPLAVQSFCITACLLIGIAVFRLRRTKVVKAANWVLMEILLTGAILLYFIIVVMYFPTSDITCLAAPWLRELGFSVMYGVLIVKIYRVLTGFQSRKAHRVHIRNKDILKFLGLFIVTTFAYMIAWTAVNLDYINSSTWDNPDGHPMSMTQRGEISVPLSSAERQQRRVSTQISLNVSMESVENISQSDSIEVLTFDVCRAMSWDVVIELSEFIILAVSVHYCRLVRSAPSEYNEILFIGVALIIELVVSGIVNVTRHFIWYTVHPDYVFLLYFARSHLTVTANLLLIFGPKAWFLYRPLTTIASQSRLRGAPGGPYSADPHLASTAKLNLALNGDLDIADINLADMDSEVIRRELRRLYTQIELYKTKAMRKDNPHISKRRGGRKQRRFSLQPFHKRHHGPPSGNVPLVIQTDSGYCWADCRPSKSEGSGKKSKHSGAHRSGPAFAGSGRAGSYYVYPGLIHDEEISKLSEESTNSLDDPSVGGGGPTQQGQQPLLLGATSSMTTVTTTAPNTTTAPTSPLLSVSKPKPEAKSDEGVKGTSKDQSKTAEFRPD